MTNVGEVGNSYLLSRKKIKYQFPSFQEMWSNLQDFLKRRYTVFDFVSDITYEEWHCQALCAFQRHLTNALLPTAHVCAIKLSLPLVELPHLSRGVRKRLLHATGSVQSSHPPYDTATKVQHRTLIHINVDDYVPIFT